MATSVATTDGVDESWEQVHSALVPLLRADNYTNIAYIAAEYAGLIAALVGCTWLYGAWTAGALSPRAQAALPTSTCFRRISCRGSKW